MKNSYEAVVPKIVQQGVGIERVQRNTIKNLETDPLIDGDFTYDRLMGRIWDVNK